MSLTLRDVDLGPDWMERRVGPVAPRALQPRTISSGPPCPTLDREEDVRHPDFVWSVASYANESLPRLAREWDQHLRGRARPVSPATREKYRKVMTGFTGSLTRAGDPLVLASVTPAAANRWITEQREAGQSEHGIASRLSALKVFTNAYVHRYLELTTVDLLRKVTRITPPEKDEPVLDQAELEQVLAAFNQPTFEHRRDAALLTLVIATGARLSEILNLTLPDDVDLVAAELTLHGKGGRVRYARLSDRAFRTLKAYLRVRPGNLTNRLWVTREGEPLTPWGAQSVMRRLKKRANIPRLHAHLLRHTFGQHAIDAGAERAAVQDMLGHQSDAMSRHYTRAARRRTASKMVAEFSPI